MSLMIVKRYPHLRAVNQDLGQAIEISKAVRHRAAFSVLRLIAEQHWKETFPEHLEKGLAEFQGKTRRKPVYASLNIPHSS